MLVSDNDFSVYADVTNAMVVLSTSVLSLFDVVSEDFDVTVVIIVSSTVVLTSIDIALENIFP